MGAHGISSWGRPAAVLAVLAVFEESAEARAQPASQASAAASAEIIDPVTISERAARASISVRAPASGVMITELAGGSYDFKATPGQVVSIDVATPPVMRRVGGAQSIASGRAVQATPSALSRFEAYTPVRVTVRVAPHAAAGLYAGDATVILNLN